MGGSLSRNNLNLRRGLNSLLRSPTVEVTCYYRFFYFFDPDPRSAIAVRAWRRGRAAKLVKTRTSAVSRHACALGVNGTPYKMYPRPSLKTASPAHRRGPRGPRWAALNSTNRNSNTSLHVKVSHKCRIHRPIQTTDKRQPGIGLSENKGVADQA